MVTAVRSLGLQGISGYEVTVECFLSGGLPAFDIVGLGDTAVKESRERVRAAVKNCGVKFPVSRITVNLAPAGRKKEGTLYDLPILLGILASAEEIKPPAKDAAFVGELSLTGTLRAVNGVLPMAMAAARAGVKTLYVPAANAAEAAEGAALGKVATIDFSYNTDGLIEAVKAARKLPGVFYIRVWLNEGTLKVGDSIMYVLIGADIRPHAVDALQQLVGIIKNDLVVEHENYE